MTPEEFRAEMDGLSKTANDDPEKWHLLADKLMHKVLRELGYGDGIDIWDQYGGWYA